MAKKKRRFLLKWFSKKKPLPRPVKSAMPYSAKQALEVLNHIRAGAHLTPELATDLPHLEAMREELRVLSMCEKTMINQVHKRHLLQQLKKMLFEYFYRKALEERSR
jgi:hypothetical protein